MMDAQEDAAEEGFITAAEESDWYQNLNREGSCLKLYKLLKKNPLLIREMGADDVTVLHKGVRQGCVKLVRYILADLFDEENRLRLGIRLTREDLLRKTTSDGVTPVAIAIMNGSPKVMILLKWAIDMIKMSGNPEMIKQVTKQMPVNQTWSLLTRKDTFTEKDDYLLGNLIQDTISLEDDTSSAMPSAQSEKDGAELEENMSAMADEQNDNYNWSELGADDVSVMAVVDQNDDRFHELGKNNEIAAAQIIGDNDNSMRLNEVVATAVLPNEEKVNIWLSSATAPNVKDGEIGDEVFDSWKDSVQKIYTHLNSGSRDGEIGNDHEIHDYRRRMVESILGLYPKMHANEEGSFFCLPKNKNKMQANVKGGEILQDDFIVSWKESVQGHYTQVYDIIKGVMDFESTLNEQSQQHHVDRRYIKFWRGKCKRDVDFEFVPVEQVFLHCIFTDSRLSIEMLGGIIRWIIDKCIASGKGLLKTLFNLHDPQGRTFLHVALEYDNYDALNELVNAMNELDEASKKMHGAEIRDCWNARDGAGRTILHVLCGSPEKSIDDWRYQEILQQMDLNARIEPLNLEEWMVLVEWSFPNLPINDYIKRNRCTPLHLAVICNSKASIKKLLQDQCDVYKVLGYEKFQIHAIQVATLLGNTTVLGLLLEKKKPLNKKSWNEDYLPMIHCAVISGQIETIRTILNYPIFDPLLQTKDLGTALHVIVKLQKVINLEVFEALALIHTLPSKYKVSKNEKNKFNPSEDDQRKYSAREMSCINLLLQSGIDIWTPHIETKDPPSPGPMANDEAIKWWYDKWISEVITIKTNISYAANATSVIAALVATASFIGPFQPPLGYAQSDGYVHIDRLPVRVYLVSNGLSFFFSVASLLMAVIPAIPMPKESLYDELKRSELSLRASALILLISIFCVLISFSAASIAIVPSDWYERRLVVFCIFLGGGVCFSVIIIYIIRLLRMLFHTDARFRRRFAKYMVF